MQLLGAKAAGPDFSQVLQLEQDFAIGAFAITMDHRFAFFVVFGQGPGRNCLDITSAKTRTAIGIEHVAAAGFVKHSPHLEALTELPATAMQDSAATI